MSTGSINSLSNNYVQSILASALQSAGVGTATTSSAGVGSTSVSDNSQLSPFAQMLSMLQQLQQTDPSKYQQVTSQIATNLQSAAKTAQSDGNTTAATQLNQLASDFNNASTTGQLPNVQDLAQALGGHHHHHGHHAASNTDSSTSNDSSSRSSSDTSLASQLLSMFQTAATTTEALNPMSIILNTLSSAGITTSQS